MNALTATFDPVAVISAFGDALRDAGFRLPGAPVMDGQWHRGLVEGDKGRKTSGRYRGYLDGWPAGFIENFKNAAATGPWKYGGDAPRLSTAERSALAKEGARKAVERARATAARLERIAEACAVRWEWAAPANADHPYLTRKGIGPDGLRIDGELLLAPMRDAEGRIRSLQTIAPDGGKLFPAGARVHGLHLLLGEVVPDGVLLVAEGWATARTLHEARIPGTAVAVAFQKSSFVPVAQAYRQRFPGLRIGLCGDNDHRHPFRDPPRPNVGKENADAAAAILGEGAATILPFFARGDEASDWNDFAALHGVEAVRLAVEAALPLPPPPPQPPLRPHYTAPALSTDETTALLESTLRALLEEAAELHAIRAAWAERTAAIDAEAPVVTPERPTLLRRARKEMARIHGEGWKRRMDRGRRVFIRGSAGLGKSTMLARLLSEFRRDGRDLGRVAYLSNLRKNFADLAAKTEGSFAVHGRLTEDPKATDGSKMCLRPATAEAVMRAGLPVSRTLCKSDDQTCPFYGRCGYQRDRHELAEGDFPFRFGAHEHLVHPAGAMKSPDVLVMDESFAHKVAAVASFGADRLSEAALSRYPGGTETEMALFRADMALVLNALRDPRGNLAGLRERGFKTADDFRSLLFLVDRAMDAMLADAVGPRTADAEVEKRLGAYRAQEIAKVQRMLLSLRAEIHLPRDRAHGVEYRPDERTEVDGQQERQDRICVMWRREIKIPKHALVIALDGTGNDLLLRRVLGDDLEVVDARCERKACVVQVIDTPMPRRRLLGPGKPGAPLDDKNAKEAERQRKRAADLINGLAAKHGDGDVFACMNLPVEALLAPRLSPNVLAGHFGGVRGSNDYQHCVAGVVLGREQARPRAVEDIARALFADDPDPLNLTGEYVEERRGIRMRDGSAVAVTVQVHPDPRVQAVLESVREDEIAQVVDRLRLIHNAEPKHVYIITNVPADVTVDRVVTFNALFHEATGQIENGRTGTGRRVYGDLLVEAFRRSGGVLPQGLGEMVRLSRPGMIFEGFWKHKTSAARALEGLGRAVHTLQKDLIGECVRPSLLVRVLYKRPGVGGDPSPALIASDTRDRAVLLAKLEAVVGPVVRDRFEVAPDPEPPPEPPPPAPPSPLPEEPEKGSEDAPDGAGDADGSVGLPFEPMSEVPPLLLRRIVERAGGRTPPRVVVLEPPPLAEVFPVPGACDPPVVLAAR